MTQRRPFKVDGALDIECADWDRFAIAATFDGRRARVYYDGDEMIDDLRVRGGVHVAHAGGVYDLLYVLNRALERGIPCQVDRAQHRVTRVVMGHLTLRDSYSLWPASLDELAGAIGESVPRLPWACICRCTCRSVPCRCGRSCGGYCQIARRAAEGDPELEDYVKADVRVLYRAMDHLGEFAADHRITLRGTLGQTAWISAQDELGIPDSTLPYHLWRSIRQADKGGRIAICRPRVGMVVPDRLVTHDPRTRREHAPAGWASTSGIVGAHHDICSAYPAQLAKIELPVGACYELGSTAARAALEACRPGLYTLSVSVPEDLFLPPLPWNKIGQLCFPTGDFSGTWVLPELVCAFERGVTVRAVHSAIVWEATAPIFGPLVQRWYEIRRSVGKKTPMGDWISGAAKALTGKLAERPDRERIVLHPDAIIVCTRMGPCRGAKGCTYRCGAYKPVDLHGLIWGVPYSRMSPSAYPQWSAYLRAATRIQWLTGAEAMTASPDGAADGGRALCMGNTDSLWHTSRQKPRPLGDGLGEWEYKHAWTDLEVRAPTIYAYRDPASESGQLEIRGIPGLTEADWRRGRGAIDRGIVTLGRAARTNRGLFHRRHREWSLPSKERTWFGDRRLHSDGLTYPATADELRELSRAMEARRRTREQVDELMSRSGNNQADPGVRQGRRSTR